MTLGLILSLAAGFIWSVGNAIDKVAVTRIVKSPVALAYIFITISVITGAAVRPLVTHPLASQDIYRFLIVSVLYTLGTTSYFWAIQKDEPSRVIPLYALVVLFLSIFGAIFLHEIFSLPVYIGIVLLIIGTVGITSRDTLMSVFRSRALGIMVISSLCYTAHTP